MAKPASPAKARGKARKFAMQALYQWHMTGDEILDIKRQYVEDNDMSPEDDDIDHAYFIDVLDGVHDNLAEIDPVLEKYMERKVGDVDPIERAIIRLAAYELKNRLDVPYRVVLNEAISLAKKFCSAQSHTFINGVLDKVARDLRALEIGTSN